MNFSQDRICTDFMPRLSNFFAYIQMCTRLTRETLDMATQSDNISVIIMFSETLHTVMSLRSIAREIELYLFVKMYLALNKWSHGADV